MKRLQTGMRAAACTLMLSAPLAGCNDSVHQDSNSPPPPPAAVEGIATPSSVAVVTATNAD